MAIKYREEALPKVSTFPFHISHWAGVNKLDGGQHDYEMADCDNMSADNYPYASPRKPRRLIHSEEGIQRIYKVDGDKVYFVDAEGCLAYTENGEKILIKDEEENSIFVPKCSYTNNYDQCTIFYPKLYYIDENNKVHNPLRRLDFNGEYESTKTYWKFTVTSQPVYISNTDIKKFDVNVKFPSVSELEFPDSGRGYAKKFDFDVIVYNKDGEEKQSTNIEYIGKTYSMSGDPFNKYYADDREKTWTIDVENFEEGDYVVLSSFEGSETASYITYRQEIFESFILAGDWSVTESEGEDSFELPLDYGTVYNNRIVGVKGNDIRASALGDFTNFYEYADEAGNPSATGAYATDVGSAGDFTGICVYNNMIMLFKRDLVYEMYGSMPYTIMELCTTGCIDNDSICEIGGVLYWASPKGIVRYSGGLPAVISHTVDIDTSGICKAGTDGRKYYAFDGKRLYVYDTYYQMWHIEKAEEVKMLYKDINTLYILCNDGIYKINEGDEAVEWEFETKDYTFKSAERKNLSKLWIRAEMESQSTLEVYVRQDRGEWERKAVKTAERDEMFDFKLRIKKCDSFAIKFKGKGKAKILDIHGKVTVGTTKHRSGASLDVYR